MEHLFKKAIHGNDIDREMRKVIFNDMRKAYENILGVEMQKLKTELKKDFRIKLGIIA